MVRRYTNLVDAAVNVISHRRILTYNFMEIPDHLITVLLYGTKQFGSFTNIGNRPFRTVLCV
ncbi:hypothetical protein D3C81_2072920 [compost metagenome]